MIGQIDFSQHYDVVFFVMPYHQMGAILDDLAAVDAETVVLVGNNLSVPEMERTIKTRSKTEKNILFGFQVTAGKHEPEYAICERALWILATAYGGMMIGRASLNAMWRQFFPLHIWAIVRTAIIRKLQNRSGSCAWTPLLRTTTCC